jgi:hypothetical protein
VRQADVVLGDDAHDAFVAIPAGLQHAVRVVVSRGRGGIDPNAEIGDPDFVQVHEQNLALVRRAAEGVWDQLCPGVREAAEFSLAELMAELKIARTGGDDIVEVVETFPGHQPRRRSHRSLVGP